MEEHDGEGSEIPESMISLAYIVRDEEKYIRRSIESAMAAVDELVVIDFFSIDSTRDICRDLGARVYRRRWRDDFSYARNVMLDKCKGDWVLTLDADEHLEGEDLGLISEAIGQLFAANGQAPFCISVPYFFRRRNGLLTENEVLR